MMKKSSIILLILFIIISYYFFISDKESFAETRQNIVLTLCRNNKDFLLNNKQLCGNI